MAEIKKKHGEQAEVIINDIKWGYITATTN